MITKEARAYVNIALIKYWGKKDQYLNLCNQASLSYTSNKYYTDAKVTINDIDVLYIDGEIANKFEQNKIAVWLDKVREIYGFKDKIKIETINNVPFKAGLASSASAYAAMSYALAKLVLPNIDKKEISKIARLGSGSATRSIFGGFVVWKAGNSHDNSYAYQLDIKWDEFKMLIVKVSDKIKTISSTKAMNLATKLAVYDDYVLKSKKDFDDILEGLKNKDIFTVGKIAEKNSNMLHEIINLSGINYYNDDTLEVIKKVNELRELKKIPVYYTIDAGANVKLITLNNYTDVIIEYFKEYQVLKTNIGGDAYLKE